MSRFFRKNKKIDGEWRTVADLTVGMQIAVPKDGILEAHKAGRIANASSVRGEQNENAEMQNGDVLWDEIVSIEHVGTEQVWDIEVEGTHNFVGNNIFAHNTYLTGNLGVATSTPFAQLGIGGSAVGTTLLGLDALSGQTAPIVDIKLASTSKFVIDSIGNVGIGTTSPGTIFGIQGVANFTTGTSTIYNNLEVRGTGRAGIWYTGDLFFANNFSFTEAPYSSTSTTQGLVLKNQMGSPVMTVDEFGNLGVNGDICANNVTCFGKSLTQLNSALSALASSTFALGSTTQNLENNIWNLVGASASSTSVTAESLATVVTALNLRIDALASSTATTTNVMSIASTSALVSSELSTSTGFIQSIAAAVQNSIQGLGDWIVNKLSAKIVNSTRIETQTAAVTQGLEMTDQATGEIYCVSIKHGDWSKMLGACSASETALTPPPVVVPIVSPIVNPELPVVGTSSPVVIPIPVITPIAMPTASSTPVASTTPVVTPTPLVSPTSVPTVTPEASSTPSPTETNTPVVTPTNSPVVTPTNELAPVVKENE